MKKKPIISTGLKEYFNFSSRERRAALVLSVVILSQLLLISYLHYRYEPLPQNRLTDKLDSISQDALTVIDVKKISLQPFNPNQLNDSAIDQLQLPSKVAFNLKRFLAKGGKFRVKEDLKKIYGISDSSFTQLKPLILLPDSSDFTFTKKHQEQKNIRVDLSTADSLSLAELRGIGPKLSSRIVRYRNALGGFISLSQLKEVYGVNDTLMNQIENSIYLSSSKPFRFLDLNTDSLPVLSTHPYVRFKIAKQILNYRMQHNGFRSVEELKRLPLVTEEIFSKLAPYLKAPEADPKNF